MPATRDIINIRHRLDRWELAHLRALSISLDDQLKAAIRRANMAEQQAEGWRSNTMELQEALFQRAGEYAADVGLTQDRHMVVMKPIGQYLPEFNGHYVGIAGDVEGGAPGHLIVMDDAPSDLLNWADAKKWAESFGNGARLPTKAEAALLFANVKDKFVAEYHWTRTQYSSSYAWWQHLDVGSQSGSNKGVEARARAVRRFPLEYFNSLNAGAA